MIVAIVVDLPFSSGPATHSLLFWRWVFQLESNANVLLVTRQQPGNTRDSRMLRLSRVWQGFQESNSRVFHWATLVSGYPLKPWLNESNLESNHTCCESIQQAIIFKANSKMQLMRLTKRRKKKININRNAWFLEVLQNTRGVTEKWLFLPLLEVIYLPFIPQF